MIKSKYLWKKQIEGIVKDKDIFELINKNRDIHDHEAFFSMGIEAIHSPYLLKDMDKAVERIKKAIEDKEKILIFGDYDCDGITSVAIMYRVLSNAGANVDYRIPDRFTDGYGLNLDIANDIVDDGYNLIITVDNGISSIEEINFIQEHKIDVILTDHHEFKETLPKAYTILHSKLSDNYPFKEIAGCMVAFKLAWAIKGEFPEELSDLAMIGTIADLMPLEAENQAIVNIGLKQLKKTTNLGLRKILNYSDLDIVNQTSIAFQIAPKINSSGRLNKGGLAIELLITEDIKKANDLILKIEENHILRKKHTERSFAIAENLVNHLDQVLVLGSDKFHEGVVGICAQRISEKYQKPTIVLTIDGDVAKGSARTFGQISILNMLKKTEDLLERFGGHDQAAGMQLKVENINAFRKRLNQLDIEDNEPELNIDMEIDLRDITKDTIQRLQEKSFHTALFLMKGLRVVRKQIIGKNHVKLSLEYEHQLFDAIKFNSLEYYYNLNENDVIDVCGGLSINRFRNKESVQIMINDLKCDHLQVIDYRHSVNTVDIQENLYPEFVVLNDETVIKTNEIKSIFENHHSFALFPKFLNINFNQIIDRNELLKVYMKLKKLPQFTKFDIMNILSLQEEVAEIIIQIFDELNFLKRHKNYYSIKDKNKADLTQSSTYQLLLDKKKTIDWLYQSTNDKINKYLEDHYGL
ncbi:MAG: single-stranded-DNA-specific exonuclease RecJ [Tenericutes bacterium]|nr:single-stranded-DNA-specific exonuclease RecJ [Mycoplasmatota bacterium]